jgi:hypothetical protein
MTARQVCTELSKKITADKADPQKTRSCGERDCNETDKQYQARKAKEEAAKIALDKKVAEQKALEDYAGTKGIDCEAMKKSDASAAGAAYNRCYSDCSDRYDNPRYCNSKCRGGSKGGGIKVGRPRQF